MPKAATLAAPPSAAPPGRDDDAAPDPAVLLAEEHLRVLKELREIGMEMVRSLAERTRIDLESAKKLAAHADSEDRYLPAGRYPAPMGDPSAMFAKLSRAVRLTMALEARTAESIRARLAGRPAAREARRAAAAARAEDETQARLEAARAKVKHIVEDAIHAETADTEEALRTCEALSERLYDDEAYADIGNRPLREVVEQICADLELEVDWSGWTGDGWARRPFPSRPKWSPFGTPSRNGCGASPDAPQETEP